MCKVTEVINLAYPCPENCKKFSVRRKINLVGQASRKESILLPHEVVMRSRYTKECELTKLLRHLSKG